MARQILSVSYDEALLSTRHLLLEREGYTVTSALGFSKAMVQCRSGSFDLFILGHSIPHNDKEALIESFREFCVAPVLSLRRQDEELVDAAEYHCFPDDPEELLAVTAKILFERRGGLDSTGVLA